MGGSAAADVREWETLCRTARLHPDVFWPDSKIYRNTIRWTGERPAIDESAIKRRINAYVCSEDVTLHLRKPSSVGDEHRAVVRGSARRRRSSLSASRRNR